MGAWAPRGLRVAPAGRAAPASSSGARARAGCRSRRCSHSVRCLRLDAERHALPVAHDRRLHLPPGRRLLNEPGQVACAPHTLAVELDDDVSGLEAGRLRRALARDLLDRARRSPPGASSSRHLRPRCRAPTRQSSRRRRRRTGTRAAGLNGARRPDLTLRRRPARESPATAHHHRRHASNRFPPTHDPAPS